MTSADSPRIIQHGDKFNVDLDEHHASVPASQEPRTLTAEDIKNLVKHHHNCADGCGCNCGRSYTEKWEPIISRFGRNAPECKCKPAPVPVVEPRPSEPLLMLNALKAVKKLFSDDSKFYIKKLGSPITNGDQAEIDAVFIAVDRAITANERLAERGCCQYCGADRSGPSAEAHSEDCPATAPPQVPSPAAISDQFIPGNYRCGQCGFVLIKSVMSVADGNIYANTRQDYELCPNDGGPMRPITWREGYEEGCKMQAELLKRLETVSEVSREPISAEQWLEFARKWIADNAPAPVKCERCGQDMGTYSTPGAMASCPAAGFGVGHTYLIRFNNDPDSEARRLLQFAEAYARAAARTCETKEK